MIENTWFHTQHIFVVLPFVPGFFSQDARVKVVIGIQLGRALAVVDFHPMVVDVGFSGCRM